MRLIEEALKTHSASQQPRRVVAQTRFVLVLISHEVTLGAELLVLLACPFFFFFVERTPSSPSIQGEKRSLRTIALLRSTY